MEVTPENKTELKPTSLTRKDYTGGKSTLCIGCGHDSITNNIITAFFKSGIDPYNVAKMSGIGCSSKTAGYFLNLSSGFNSVHGRMAAVATGAKISNRKLTTFGVSGDGDTASIGLGSFAHLIRRNLPMTYLVENNGVYGLTKGQFSATADLNSKQKSGASNPFEGIDLCSMALDLGCSFVARSFSGDTKQLVPLLSAAFRHRGTAFIDVISPCVTFNNHEGSTKSYDTVREQNIALQQLGFIQPQEEKKVDYEEGDVETIELHDGSMLTLRKLDSRKHDITDRLAAQRLIQETKNSGEILTGLFYLDKDCSNFIDTLNLTEKPLAHLNEQDTRPSADIFQKTLAGFK